MPAATSLIDSPPGTVNAKIRLRHSFIARESTESCNACQQHSVTDFCDDPWMGTIGERVRSEREALGLSRQELARLTGIGYSTLAELERGGMQTSTKLNVIADALKVSVRWLQTGKGEKHDAIPAADPDWTDIIASAQGLAAGGGSVPDDYAETHKLRFRQSSLARKGLRPKTLQVHYVSGDSMLPRLHDGDAILVDTSDTKIKDGAIYWIRYEGHHFVKQLHKAGKSTVIESMNKTDPQWRKPIVVADGDDFEPLGRVRWVGSWED
jgi:phage repressor protein C with HTH and peptisase S24 domain